MSAEHFPPLCSHRNITKVAFGLPKHSLPCDEIMEKRLQNQYLPPIAAIGSSSIVVGSVPLNFTWQSRNAEENDISESSMVQSNETLHFSGNSGVPDQNLELSLSSMMKQSKPE